MNPKQEDVVLHRSEDLIGKGERDFLEKRICGRCNGDGLEMCRIDGCDRDDSKKCIDCNGSGKL
jgi:DnaJ-class molecular chaperone